MTKNNKMGNCRTCMKEVAKRAKVCPLCGEKKPVKQKSNILLYIITPIAIFWLVGKVVPDNTRTVPSYSNNASAPSPSAPKNWTKYVTISPVDDSKTVKIVTDAISPSSGKFGKVRFNLTLRCIENKTDAVIDFKQYLGLNQTKVTYRIDSKPALTRAMGISTNNEAVFVKNPIPFIKSLLNQTTMFVKTTPYGENPVSAEFNVSELEAEIKELRQACGW